MINIELCIGQSDINRFLRKKSIKKSFLKKLKLSQVDIEFDSKTYGSKQIVIRGRYNYGFLFSKKSVPIKIRIEPYIKNGKFKFYIKKIIADRLPITTFVKLQSKFNKIIFENYFINILFKNSIYINSKILSVLVPKSILVKDKHLILKFKIGG